MTQETDRVYSDFTKSASFNDLRVETFKEDIEGYLHQIPTPKKKVYPCMFCIEL